jgi:hypothetical protein
MINPSRIRKALAALREAEKELEQALADDDRPAPNPLPRAVQVSKPRKSLRRGIS